MSAWYPRIIISLICLLSLATPLMAQTPEPLTQEDCPTFAGQSSEVRTSYYMGEAVGLLRTNQLSQAINSLTCILDVINPDYLPAFMTRASIHAQRRSYDEAIADYSAALRLAPDLAAAYNNRGIIYTALLEYEEAASDFDRALELDENFIAVYNNRGVLHLLAGETEAAIELLESIIERSGIDVTLETLSDPQRPSSAPDVEYNLIDTRAYALLGIAYSQQALNNYNNYIFLARGNADGRIQSAAGALSSRFNFEMRLDDGTWLLTAAFSPTTEVNE